MILVSHNNTYNYYTDKFQYERILQVLKQRIKDQN